MKFLQRVYSVTMFENGSFCWKYSVREKTINDYRDSETSLFLWAVAVVVFVLVIYL